MIPVIMVHARDRKVQSSGLSVLIQAALIASWSKFCAVLSILRFDSFGYGFSLLVRSFTNEVGLYVMRDFAKDSSVVACDSREISKCQVLAKICVCDGCTLDLR